MDYTVLQPLLARIQGTTFASLDVQTKPSSGLVKTSLGVSVILFSGKTDESGYENMVRRRLEKAGKDPLSFSLGDLPWGDRVQGTPLIMSASGKLYLQCIILSPGTAKYFFLGKEYPRERLTPSQVKSGEDDGFNQGLEKEDRVVVRTYSLDNILEIRLLGETLGSVSVPRVKREQLSLKLKS